MAVGMARGRFDEHFKWIIWTQGPSRFSASLVSSASLFVASEEEWRLACRDADG